MAAKTVFGSELTDIHGAAVCGQSRDEAPVA